MMYSNSCSYMHTHGSCTGSCTVYPKHNNKITFKTNNLDKSKVFILYIMMCVLSIKMSVTVIDFCWIWEQNLQGLHCRAYLCAVPGCGITHASV